MYKKLMIAQVAGLWKDLEEKGLEYEKTLRKHWKKRTVKELKIKSPY